MLCSVGGRAGSAKTGSHAETLYARVGWGHITYAGICTSKNFGPGYVEVGRALQQMQLADKVGFEEVMSNDSNNACQSSMRWAREIHIVSESKTDKENERKSTTLLPFDVLP